MEEKILEKLQEYYNDKVKIEVDFSGIIREYIITIEICNIRRTIKYQWDYHFTDDANMMTIKVEINNAIVKMFMKGIEE